MKEQSILSALPMDKATILIHTLAKRYSEGETTFSALHKLAMEALADGRIGLICHVMQIYPRPTYAGGPQDPEAIEVEQRINALRDTLPGLFSAAPTLNYRMQAVRAEAEAAMAERSPVDLLMEELMEKLDAYPFWRACIFHPESTVRLLALNLLGESPNPARETALVILAADPISVVRARARDLIGYHEPGKRVRKYKDSDVNKRGSAMRCIQEIAKTTNDTELQQYLDDPRVHVRFAVAMQLEPESNLWPILAHDAAPRVRRVAAERASLAFTDIHAQLLQDKEQQVRSAAGARRLAQDIPLPTKSESAELKERKAEWTDKYEESLNGRTNDSQ